MNTTPDVTIRESGFISVADTAKLLRAALRAAFPGQKFSVRSDSYAGGASIRIRYQQDAVSPKTADVEKVARRFEGASFDGMIDLKSHHTTLITVPGEELPREVYMGADYIFVDSELVPAYAEQLAQVAFAEAKKEPQRDGAPTWEHDPNAYLTCWLNGHHFEGSLHQAVRALANPRR